MFENSKSLFNVDKEKIIQCGNDFNTFSEDKATQSRDSKTLNDFFCELPEGSHSVLELADLERL